MLGTLACGGGGGDETPDAAPAPDAAAPEEPTLTEIQGTFAGPESAHWDATGGVWYVSNFGQNLDLSGATPDQPGYISRIAADGTVLDERLAEMAGDYVGLAVLGDKLYVAHTPHILEIDTATGTVSNTIDIPDAMFLNDIAAGANAVYVSDTVANIIYRYEPGGQPEVYSQDPALLGINGIFVDGEQLIAVTLGGFPPNGMGGVFSIIPTGEATRIGDLTGSLDGIEKVGDQYLVSDFAGTLHLVSADGTHEVLVDAAAEYGLASTADIGHNPTSGAVMIPDLAGNKVYRYTWPH